MVRALESKTELNIKSIESEAELTIFESISMIVGHSIGTGIIAVPYLATKNSLKDVIWILALGYIINVILHLLIAELSYNNGGVQKVFSWGMFIVYGGAIMLGVSGNINGGAQIIQHWFSVPFSMAQVIYYLLAGVVVFMGMKAVGIAQKYTVILLIIIVSCLTIGTFMNPMNSLVTAPFHPNNLLALYSMVVFATSANQAVIQSVKGLKGDPKKIRFSILVGFAISTCFVLIVTSTVLLGSKGVLDKEMAYLQLGKSIAPWAALLAGVFSLLALLSTFWSNTLSLRDVVHEQVGLNNKVCWILATLPCIAFSLFGVSSFIVLTRLMSGVVVLVGIMLIFTYNRSRKSAGSSPICGKLGTVPFQILMVVSTAICAVGALLPLT
jgi:amino acid permease